MPHDDDARTIPLYGKRVSVTMENVVSDHVRVVKSAEERAVLIEEEVEHGALQVERVQFEIPVQNAPAPHQEGDTLIVSLVEKRLVPHATPYRLQIHEERLEMLATVGETPHDLSTCADRLAAVVGEVYPRLALIAGLVPEQARSLAAFYTRYAEHRPPAPTVVHGDLVAEHILLDEDSGQRSGIIDFGDVALGDPAQDFLGFWTYGTAAAARAAELYRSPDPDLLERSRDHFIRYGLDRLLGDVIHAGDALLEHAELAARIDALLAFERIPQTDTGDDDGRF